ncbi:hypothetical protein GCK72_025833 [Caenorhabditis remanei]|uniref:Uncharacterized protein n=1 Tax=Caenorhabditis remanei TaxID=31234 RepID=A0A6A5G3S4_CAERE|nr:hypothetical protein GCK72_025833 [Caenorhabditis remanei]KAF1749365.1 hypothetical protein GCK72_025833 [Caenorhabditis remanei]
MSATAIEQHEELEEEKEKPNTICLVCKDRGVANFNKVFSCAACKSFFTRTLRQSKRIKDSVCKKQWDCFDQEPPFSRKCAPCRLKKCIDVGMLLTSKIEEALKLRGLALNQVIIILSKKDYRIQEKLMTHYSVRDPTLDQVLADRDCAKLEKMTPGIKMTAHEWAYLDVYSRIVSYLEFDFINFLEYKDKKILFTYNSMRMLLLGGAMRTVREKRAMLMTPDGEDVYPEVVYQLFGGCKQVLMEICCELSGKLIDLQVTYEEYLFLMQIFFLNPSISDQLSDKAKATLAEFQDKFSYHLLLYCQHTYQQHASSRYGNLLSLMTVVDRISSRLQCVSMLFQVMVPTFPFKKLVADTFVNIGTLPPPLQADEVSVPVQQEFFNEAMQNIEAVNDVKMEQMEY